MLETAVDAMHQLPDHDRVFCYTDENGPAAAETFDDVSQLERFSMES